MVAFVQSKNGFSSGNTLSITFNSSVTAGNMLFVVCNNYPGFVSLSDNLGNTYIPLSDVYESRTFYVASALGGSTTLTATYSDYPSGALVFAREYSGVNSIDQFAKNYQTGPGTYTATSATTTTNDELVVGLFSGFFYGCHSRCRIFQLFKTDESVLQEFGNTR